MSPPHRPTPALVSRREPARDADPDLVLLEALTGSRSRGAMERILAVAAAHRDGLGADAAHVLRWNETTGVFECAARAVAAAGDEALQVAVAHGADEAPPESASDATSAWEPESLDEVSLEAWRTGSPRSGKPRDGLAPWRDADWVAAMPLDLGGRERGLLIAEHHGDEPTTQARLDRFFHLACFALEGRERVAELARRAQQAAALDEMAQTVVAPRNVAEVQHAAARLACFALEADGAALWIGGGESPLVLRVTHGAAGTRERVGRALHPVAAAAVERGKPIVASSATDEPLLPAAAAAEVSAFAVRPILAYGRPVGAIAVWTTHGGRTPPEMDHPAREFLSALAHVTGLALDHARRLAELREAARREEDAVRWAKRREGLAALGERAATASQDSLKAVASIRAFTSRLLKSLGPDDPSREFAEVIQRESDRLERMLAEQRAAVDVASPSLQMLDLNGLADRALQRLGEALVRRRARVLKKLAPDLPRLLLDPRGIEHVIATLLELSLESITLGGRIRIETRRLPQHVLFELGHDGGRADLLEQLFAPFAGGPLSEAGRRLGVAQRVIQLHGGELRARGDGEWTTVVTITLPVQGNEDRRRPAGDRRRGRDRRGSLAPSEPKRG